MLTSLKARLNASSSARLLGWAALGLALGGPVTAAGPTIVNIADPTTPANKAKVDGTGALRMGDWSPRLPFFGQAYINIGTSITLLGPSTATAALTRLTIDNYYAQPNGAHVEVLVLEDGGSTTSCDQSDGSLTIGRYDVAAGQTIFDAMPSPIVLKPLVAGHAWCLSAVLVSVEGGPESYYLPTVTWSGYVISGKLPDAAPTVAARAATPPRAGQ